MTVIKDQPGLMRYDGLLFVFYSLAALPVTAFLRIVWQHGLPLRVISWLLLIATFSMALVATALLYKLALSFHVLKGDFQWSAILLRMQTIWFLLIAYCAMYIGVGYYLMTQEEQRKTLAAVNLAKEAELKALRYQVHPHFLFNTLNAISTLVVDERPRDATRMIAQLADFLRTTLSHHASNEVTVEEELSFTERYLEIEKVRLGQRLVVELNIDAKALAAAVPYLLLQPLVENAIRHGIARRPAGGRLLIEMNVVAERLRISVWNEGVAEHLADKTWDASDGGAIGLQNVRERLRHLYDNDHRCTMSLEEDGSCSVAIDLPYRLMSSYGNHASEESKTP
ncbi:sensor histidine kinase [Dyella psychrodurans]|uniref:sensor histidine kinase n=1 Tax=Dyella psychrodurans TaxID=1927960 RepID=UPI001313F992|nr:histidine kinase [Dyella psychrodurans]